MFLGKHKWMFTNILQTNQRFDETTSKKQVLGDEHVRFDQTVPKTYKFCILMQTHICF